MNKSGFPRCRCLNFSSNKLLQKTSFILAVVAVLTATSLAQDHALGTRRLFGDAHTASPQFAAARGAESVASALTSGTGRPVSLVSADVFSRGREDAIAGYMTARGAAIVIQGTTSPRALRDSTSLFEASATVLNVPVSPDFITVADVNQDGLRDIIFGARGDSRIYIMAQGYKGTFSKPVAIALPGGLSALASDGIGSDMRKHFVIAGVSTQNAGAVIVLRGSASGLVPFNRALTPAAPTNLALGNLDATGNDLAFTAAGKVFVLHGDDLLSSKAPQPEAVPSSGNAVQVAIATFVPHRGARSQLAVLNSSGEVSILARGTLDFRPYTAQDIRAIRTAMRARGSKFQREEPGLSKGAAHDGNWTTVTSISTAAGANARLLASRTSGRAGTDISVVSPDQSRIVTISHARSNSAAVPQSVVTETALAAPATSVVPMRLGGEGRKGLVLLTQNSAQPMLALPAGSTTITVDTFNDSHDADLTDNNCDDGTGSCSLRAAIEEANARDVNDTIVLPDGTYTLTLGQLDITAGMTIQSQSGDPNSVIIDGGQNGRVFGVDYLGTSAFDATISGVTITDGVTSGGPGPADGAGIAWDAAGTGTLTLTNVIVTNNISLDGGGGGMLLINSQAGSGSATVSDSTITANLADDVGGGAEIAGQVFFNNVVMDSNLADNTMDPTGGAQGGCYYFFANSSQAGLSEIHGGQITNCNSITDGAGIYTNVGLVIDAGANPTLLIDSNSAGGNGGGIYQATSSAGDVSSFANVTITNNTSGGKGSGIYEASSDGSVIMNFSRFTQNLSAGGSTGLAFFNAMSGAAIDITRNWWACNTSPDGAPCDAIDDSAAAVNFTPWIVLTHTGTPNPIQLGPSADVTLTAGFLKDSNGGAIAPGSISSLIGIPIDFDNAVNGTLSNAQSAIQPAGNATATLTVTSGPTATADAIVDGFAATATITVQTADLSITKTHTGNFFRGQTGATYTLTVKNVGSGASSGTVTLTDTLPSDLTATAIAGTGWTCTLATLTCTRADVLNGGASYPAVTLTVNVSGTAAATVTNTAKVAGGGDTNNVNNSASDPANVVAAFTFTTTAPTATVAPGQTASYPFSLTFPAGASGTISFACSNVPAGASCAFAPPQVTMSSGGTAPMTMTIATRSTSGTHVASLRRRSGASFLAFALLPAFGIVLLGTTRRKKLLRLAVATLLFVIALGATGCGDTASGTFTPIGSYTISVTATSNSNQQVSTTVTLNIAK